MKNGAAGGGEIGFVCVHVRACVLCGVCVYVRACWEKEGNSTLKLKVSDQMLKVELQKL